MSGSGPQPPSLGIWGGGRGQLLHLDSWKGDSRRPGWYLGREHLMAPGHSPSISLQGVWVGVSTCAALWGGLVGPLQACPLGGPARRR